uniref:Uncharacterized protein n=1 Tax=Oryza glumipatula TaxID=40148 RepID=A0A0D9ZLD9_9ORYZ
MSLELSEPPSSASVRRSSSSFYRYIQIFGYFLSVVLMDVLSRITFINDSSRCWQINLRKFFSFRITCYQRLLAVGR